MDVPVWSCIEEMKILFAEFGHPGRVNIANVGVTPTIYDTEGP
jgi:hypothetical protein